MATARAHFEDLVARCEAVGWRVDRTRKGHAKVFPTSGGSFTLAPPGNNGSYTHHESLVKRYGLLEAEAQMNGSKPAGRPAKAASSRAHISSEDTLTDDGIDRLPDGRVVVARGPAKAPHPYPGQNGRMVTFTGVEEVMLESGEILYRCVSVPDCPYLAESPRSVASHMAAHNRKPIYPPEVIRKVLRMVMMEAQIGHHGKLERVAAALNRQGVPTARGELWTASMVNGVYHNYKDRYRVRVPAARPKEVSETKAKPSARPAASEPAADRAETPTLPVPTELGPMMVYAFPLRPDLVIRLTLPQDLTVAESERLAGFVRSLAF